MSYNVYKSDPAKSYITVPDTAPYSNVTDTSLSIVGRGNPNYGQSIAENFVHLLENFASPDAPSNPIEGQLWYDTSAPTNKILKVYNNAAWVPTNGVHRAENKDTITGIASPGDIYVHPRGLDQVHIWDGNSWIPIGPAIASGTKNGVFAEEWSPNDGTLPKAVIATYINDEVITVISRDTFTPNPIRNGFTELKPGLNVSTQEFDGTTAKLSGLTTTALYLKVAAEVDPIPADNFLRNDKTGIIEGFLSVSGLRVGATTPSVFLERTSNNVALLTNRTNAASIGLAVLKDNVINQIVTVDGNNLRVGINKLSPTATLDVNGSVKISGLTQLGITGTNSLEVLGNMSVNGTFTATGTVKFDSLLTVGQTSGTGTGIEPAAPSAYDLGSTDYPFRTVYANSFANTSTTYSYVVTGMIMLHAGIGVPEGWLECSTNPLEPVVLDATTGTVFTRLYNSIGTTYGGTGPTDFQLPVFDDLSAILAVGMKPLIKL
jgi:hypothetical protein